MTELQPLTDQEESVLAAGDAYAAACADQEEARIAEPYDNAHWSSLCDRTTQAHSRLLRAAKALSTRRTDPPELRPGGSMYHESR